VAVVAVSGCGGADQPTRVTRDPLLRTQPVFLYGAADTTRPPRAVIFFFGNDIGFWKPHRQLAASLARAQIAVAGFDMRPLLRTLPPRGAIRDSTFMAAIEQWVATGTAPDSISASHATAGTVDRTRPLCPYGKVAKWKGSGSTDDAANFSCVAG